MEWNWGNPFILKAQEQSVSEHITIKGAEAEESSCAHFSKRAPLHNQL